MNFNNTLDNVAPQFRVSLKITKSMTTALQQIEIVSPNDKLLRKDFDKSNEYSATQSTTETYGTPMLGGTY